MSGLVPEGSKVPEYTDYSRIKFLLPLQEADGLESHGLVVESFSAKPLRCVQGSNLHLAPRLKDCGTGRDLS